jgi:hypothetical protein
LPVGWPESRRRCPLSPRAREAAPGHLERPRQPGHRAGRRRGL